MIFNSVEFLIFFPIVAALFYLLPHRNRWVLLLVASYFFYMSWRPQYVILLVLSTLVDYFVGIRMAAEVRPHFRRAYLIFSIVTNLGLLFVFKYFNFFSASANTLFQSIGVNYPLPMLDILLPVGISFYTFQTLSYSIDVYRGKTQPEKHLGIFALFVAFFPQLVAGPIERSNHLLPQFYKTITFDYERVVGGLQRIAWGFFKKIVIADRLALMVNIVYGSPTQYTGNYLIIATIAFGFQIYCDFSAYSDIAIGAARVIGFDLMENFWQPYYARSVQEFWQRWHISLSTWFRDYLYIPLGGNRVSIPRWSLNIMIVFIVSGLWHGASWTFVIWGAIHGFLIVVTMLWSRVAYRIPWSLPLPAPLKSGVQIFLTFALVTFAWIFFRANSLSDAVYIVRHLFTNLQFTLSGYGSIMPGGAFQIAIAFVAILLMESVHWLQMTTGSVRLLLRRQPIWLRWSAYYALVFLIIMFGKFGFVEFIYFQF
jgi:alginate O-acetyltransferase complex protein AlgI